MPLLHSHIRFAVDIRESLHVENLAPYISGTMYPDSGYISGLDKDITHPADFLERSFFHESDFGKGCFAHVLYDRLFDRVARKSFPELFSTQWNGQRKGSELWAGRTALKILQDIEDAKAIQRENYLPHLEYAENPNQEKLDEVREYNSILQKVFAEKGDPYEKYYRMWTLFRVEEYKVAMIREFVEKFRKDPRTLQTIGEIYGHTRLKWEKSRN